MSDLIMNYRNAMYILCLQSFYFNLKQFMPRIQSLEESIDIPKHIFIP